MQDLDYLWKPPLTDLERHDQIMDATIRPSGVNASTVLGLAKLANGVHQIPGDRSVGSVG